MLPEWQNNHGGKQRTESIAPVSPDLEDGLSQAFFPPDANCATREAVGWKMDDPRPTTPTAINIKRYCSAKASSISPVKVKHMPIDKA